VRVREGAGAKELKRNFCEYLTVYLVPYLSRKYQSYTSDFLTVSYSRSTRNEVTRQVLTSHYPRAVSTEPGHKETVGKNDFKFT